ncbi:hypothetical protein SAY87_006411 [Trapa incisa]|uniref:Uncharacterized protein n=1 Tax=Trapa incisa TaxID=236973 RepID=A0AAN7K0Y2_9MYRT|nr:hypothetical protein SAY87_006411 [Trapa incisa]
MIMKEQNLQEHSVQFHLPPSRPKTPPSSTMNPRVENATTGLGMMPSKVLESSGGLDLRVRSRDYTLDLISSEENHTMPKPRGFQFPWSETISTVNTEPAPTYFLVMFDTVVLSTAAASTAGRDQHLLL